MGFVAPGGVGSQFIGECWWGQAMIGLVGKVGAATMRPRIDGCVLQQCNTTQAWLPLEMVPLLGPSLWVAGNVRPC